MTGPNTASGTYWSDVQRRTAAHRSAWALTIPGVDRAWALPTYLNGAPAPGVHTLRLLIARAPLVAAPAGRWLAGYDTYAGVRFTHPDVAADSVVAAEGLLAIYRNAGPTTRYSQPDEWRRDAGRNVEKLVLALLEQHAADPLPNGARTVLHHRILSV